MPMPIETLSELIKKKIPDAEFDIKDLRGDDNHYHAIIKSTKFKGLSKVQQHQLVYSAIGDQMGTTLHALMLTTITKK
tara:strand:+ start:79 stop:312 length:234 start_codon:yes stop_codon:yes gene_type:complete